MSCADSHGSASDPPTITTWRDAASATSLIIVVHSLAAPRRHATAISSLPPRRHVAAALRTPAAPRSQVRTARAPLTLQVTPISRATCTRRSLPSSAGAACGWEGGCRGPRMLEGAVGRCIAIRWPAGSSPCGSSAGHVPLTVRSWGQAGGSTACRAPQRKPLVAAHLRALWIVHTPLAARPAPPAAPPAPPPPAAPCGCACFRGTQLHLDQA